MTRAASLGGAAADQAVSTIAERLQKALVSSSFVPRRRATPGWHFSFRLIRRPRAIISASHCVADSGCAFRWVVCRNRRDLRAPSSTFGIRVTRRLAAASPRKLFVPLGASDTSEAYAMKSPPLPPVTGGVHSRGHKQASRVGANPIRSLFADQDAWVTVGDRGRSFYGSFNCSTVRRVAASDASYSRIPRGVASYWMKRRCCRSKGTSAATCVVRMTVLSIECARPIS